MTEKLTDRAYWDDVHEHGGEDLLRARKKSAWTRGKAVLKKKIGPRLVQAMHNYEDYVLWDAILPRFLQDRAGARAVEVGSAPGDFLVTLRNRFAVAPYGIEYSPVGADLNRKTFAAAGIDSTHVIEGDFFAPDLHETYRQAFDIVCSRGFIEHFSDPSDAIARHLNLLKPGGLLVVSIPNLRGLNHILAWLFDRHVLAMHNLSIMERRRFQQLFAVAGLERLYCGYFGTFNLRLFNAKGRAGRWLMRTASPWQAPLNVAFRTLLGARGVETPWLSPNLLFVGRKDVAG